ncbi:hypothetical protein BDA96_06G042900 [Sorghum bicolor]|uniref:Uncharacterized protein n=2 Tax=Sorghum bicolor TaxID=4558 RepID=A0A921QQM7_SORBI|nr:hypothetical protein BDA96_06G042900 [Sorghum bicolor]KXG25983.1 hypothetical protein SORBI_3006G039300 [Sorghum bicolor]
MGQAISKSVAVAEIIKKRIGYTRIPTSVLSASLMSGNP